MNEEEQGDEEGVEENIECDQRGAGCSSIVQIDQVVVVVPIVIIVLVFARAHRQRQVVFALHGCKVTTNIQSYTRW